MNQSVMDERKRLCSLVLESGMSLSGACRELGVSRPTGRLWVSRARDVGISEISALSRVPLHQPSRTSLEVESRLLSVSDQYPFWGPRKILSVAFPDSAPVCARTVARILKRSGRSVQVAGKPLAVMRFERDHSNELWQIDFKKVGTRQDGVDVLSVVDDASRFCMALEKVPDQTLVSVQNVLWEAFAEFGMPEAILSDNGPAFRCMATWRWSKLDLWLKLLGIGSSHGRPRHPQTQGKVERFHGTMEREGVVAETIREFRNRYNWVRPHEALAMQTPGRVYEPSRRERPDAWPINEHPSGAQIRKTSAAGIFSYQGKTYKAGVAFESTTVAICTLDNIPTLMWANQPLCPLLDLLWD